MILSFCCGEKAGCCVLPALDFGLRTFFDATPRGFLKRAVSGVVTLAADDIAVFVAVCLSSFEALSSVPCCAVLCCVVLRVCRSAWSPDLARAVALTGRSRCAASWTKRNEGQRGEVRAVELCWAFWLGLCLLSGLGFVLAVGFVVAVGSCCVVFAGPLCFEPAS